MEDLHVKLNFSPVLIRLQGKRLSRPDFRSTKRHKNFSRFLRVMKSHAHLQRSSKRPKSAGGSRCLRKATPSSHGEQIRTAGPQAWAEFCLAYCKRLGLLLAMPAMKVGCSARMLRFTESDGEAPGCFLRKLIEKPRTLEAVLSRFSIARK